MPIMWWTNQNSIQNHASGGKRGKKRVSQSRLDLMCWNQTQPSEPWITFRKPPLVTCEISSIERYSFHFVKCQARTSQCKKKKKRRICRRTVICVFFPYSYWRSFFTGAWAPCSNDVDTSSCRFLHRPLSMGVTAAEAGGGNLEDSFEWLERFSRYVELR